MLTIQNRKQEAVILQLLGIIGHNGPFGSLAGAQIASAQLLSTHLPFILWQGDLWQWTTLGTMNRLHVKLRRFLVYSKVNEFLIEK